MNFSEKKTYWVLYCTQLLPSIIVGQCKKTNFKKIFNVPRITLKWYYIERIILLGQTFKSIAIASTAIAATTLTSAAKLWLICHNLKEMIFVFNKRNHLQNLKYEFLSRVIYLKLCFLASLTSPKFEKYYASKSVQPNERYSPTNIHTYVQV